MLNRLISVVNARAANQPPPLPVPLRRPSRPLSPHSLPVAWLGHAAACRCLARSGSACGRTVRLCILAVNPLCSLVLCTHLALHLGCRNPRQSWCRGSRCLTVALSAAVAAMPSTSPATLKQLCTSRSYQFALSSSNYHASEVYLQHVLAPFSFNACSFMILAGCFTSMTLFLLSIRAGVSQLFRFVSCPRTSYRTRHDRLAHTILSIFRVEFQSF